MKTPHKNIPRSALASGAANDALIVGTVRRSLTPIRWSHRIHVRREGAPNYNRGGCAPQIKFNTGKL
jgi:hypothetical protein